METVRPLDFNGYSFSLFHKSPMFHITCGNCRGSFSQRIPMVDEPGLKCPHCGTINIMPLVLNRNQEDKSAKS